MEHAIRSPSGIFSDIPRSESRQPSRGNDRSPPDKRVPIIESPTKPTKTLREHRVSQANQSAIENANPNDNVLCLKKNISSVISPAERQRRMAELELELYRKRKKVEEEDRRIAELEEELREVSRRIEVRRREREREHELQRKRWNEDFDQRSTDGASTLSRTMEPAGSFVDDLPLRNYEETTCPMETTSTTTILTTDAERRGTQDGPAMVNSTETLRQVHTRPVVPHSHQPPGILVKSSLRGDAKWSLKWNCHLLHGRLRSILLSTSLSTNERTTIATSIVSHPSIAR